MPLLHAYQFKCHILNPWLIKMKPFPPYPLLAFCQFHSPLVLHLVWHCFEDDFLAFPYLSWTLFPPFAFPLVVLPRGFWSPVSLDELCVSLRWVTTVYLVIFHMLRGFIFSVEWFYQQWFSLLLLLLSLSSFSWSVCACTTRVPFHLSLILK